LVNYSAFDASDIVRFNALLDEKRKADGVVLPASTRVIGLTDTSNPNCYVGADFYSRFNKVEACPLDLTQLAQALPPQPFELFTEEKQDTAPINLFHASDWKERLLGRWVLSGKELIFEEGALIPALNSGKPIVIENGLWDDPEFNQFWQQAAVSKTISHPQGPLNIQLPYLRHDGYDWDALLSNTKWDNMLYPGGITLNPGQIGQLFHRYQCVNKTLKTVPGWLKTHATASPKKCVDLNLTRALNEDEWAECLTKAKQLNLKLRIHCAPGVQLPSELEIKLPEPQAFSHKRANRYWLDEAIISTDIDTTIKKLTAHTQAMVLDISECEAADLFIKITGQLDHERLDFTFNSTTNAVLKALHEGETVILKGSFSPELTDALAALLLQRKDKARKAKGCLILVSDNELFPFLPQEKQYITNEEKLSYLKGINSFELNTIGGEAALSNESLAQLQTRLNFIRRNPNKSSNDAWIGMHRIPAQIKLSPLDFNHSEELARAFTQKRLDQVNKVLAYNPYVFLTGLTAVGKTTFVTKHLAKDCMLYQGESQLKEWALDTSNQRKILFIDEANLSPRQWSEFEGLFHKPQGVLVDGTFIPLSPQHKVVFAGNPVNYGDDRKCAPLFMRHGNAILFEPLPLANVYEDVLRPIFVDTPLASQTAALCQPIIDCYEFLYPLSTEGVLISPRELQMMALLVSSYCEQHPKANAHEVAYYYAYQITKSLVPAAHRESFELRFKEPKELIRPPFSIPQPLRPGACPQERVILDLLAPADKPRDVGLDRDFIITPTRQKIKNQLDDLLRLRHYRRQPHANDGQKYGGLGGIILDGEPGIGKSELVIHTLTQQGYIEVHPPFCSLTSDRAFYCMPVSLGIEEKEKILIDAFDAGIVVVVDEINSSPMMEQLLNNLLMGKRPQGTNHPNPEQDGPNKPGFMVIGTQNPITMAGRIAPSNALRRRLIHVELPPYPEDEMLTVLLSKGLNKIYAQALITAFTNQLNTAKTKQHSPLPCFRDLMRVAKEVIGTIGKGSVFQNDILTSLGTNSSTFFSHKVGILGNARQQAMVLGC
jgi:hypothetical protein